MIEYDTHDATHSEEFRYFNQYTNLIGQLQVCFVMKMLKLIRCCNGQKKRLIDKIIFVAFMQIKILCNLLIKTAI